MDIRAAVLEADRRIRPRVRRTPVEHSASLSEAGQCRAYLKLECHQLTGSFKFRGALNKLLSLDEAALARGVVAASSGNHGMAVACAANAVGSSAVVFVPECADDAKVAAIRKHGTEVRDHGSDCVIAEAAARAFGRREGRAYISPYNDADVIAGQGTVGLELDQQLPDVDVVLVALGGGGLVSGIGGYLRSTGRPVQIVACSPVNSSVMHASLRAGRILDLPSKPTLSDGTAGGVEPGAITFELCREIVNDSLVVTEDGIAAAMRFVIAHHHVLIEGAAAVPVAAFLNEGSRFAGQTVAIVLCGANIAPAVLKSIL